ncbi:cholecystokinin receptor-like [Tachypleus tridentatus]|uniref:cholecystokinin receptor-like n=1 Tax=Tachypleus tridentatus TaxID=6853 RepID=UPI003FCFE696
MLPIAILSRLLPTSVSGHYKCRDVWPSVTLERVFNLYLDSFLLVVPLLVMIFMYSLIIHTLCINLQGRKEELPLRFLSNRNQNSAKNGSSNGAKQVIVKTSADKNDDNSPVASCSRKTVHCHLVVRERYSKGRVAKKRIIRMLFVVVLNFFICWTPLFVINTWTLYDPSAVYRNLPPSVISAIHLLAYLSSCCNPIIYCFMHVKYRQAFMSVFTCRRRHRWTSYRWSNKSATLNSKYSVRALSAQSNAVVGLESESL